MITSEPLTFTIPDERRWEVKLEDWKMAKDRINQFDDHLVKIRTTGIPIILLFIGIGFTISDRISGFQILGINGAALPFIFATLYIIPLAILDYVHYTLLGLAVGHALDIENSKEFTGLLGITKSLTTSHLNFWHRLAMYSLYLILFVLTIAMIFVFWNGPATCVPQTTITAGLLSKVGL